MKPHGPWHAHTWRCSYEAGVLYSTAYSSQSILWSSRRRLRMRVGTWVSSDLAVRERRSDAVARVRFVRRCWDWALRGYSHDSRCSTSALLHHDSLLLSPIANIILTLSPRHLRYFTKFRCKITVAVAVYRPNSGLSLLRRVVSNIASEHDSLRSHTAGRHLTVPPIPLGVGIEVVNWLTATCHSRRCENSVRRHVAEGALYEYEGRVAQSYLACIILLWTTDLVSV